MTGRIEVRLFAAFGAHLWTLATPVPAFGASQRWRRR
jgi:hypothetical protein